jgi:hypothetical protein
MSPRDRLPLQPQKSKTVSIQEAFITTVIVVGNAGGDEIVGIRRREAEIEDNLDSCLIQS